MLTEQSRHLALANIARYQIEEPQKALAMTRLMEIDVAQDEGGQFPMSPQKRDGGGRKGRKAKRKREKPDEEAPPDDAEKSDQEGGGGEEMETEGGGILGGPE